MNIYPFCPSCPYSETESGIVSNGGRVWSDAAAEVMPSMWMTGCWLGTGISGRRVLLDASVVSCSPAASCFFLGLSSWDRYYGWTFLFLEVVLAWSFIHSLRNTQEATTIWSEGNCSMKPSTINIKGEFVHNATAIHWRLRILIVKPA